MRSRRPTAITPVPGDLRIMKTDACGGGQDTYYLQIYESAGWTDQPGTRRTKRADVRALACSQQGRLLRPTRSGWVLDGDRVGR